MSKAWSSRIILIAAVCALIAGCVTTDNTVGGSARYVPRPIVGFDIVRPRKLNWGKEASGFKLAAWLIPEHQAIACVVKYVNDRNMYYCKSQLGWWEWNTVLANPDGRGWEKIERRKSELRIYTGCGPSYGYSLAHPEEELIGRELQRVLDGINRKDNQSYNYSFLIDVLDFEWPDTLRNGQPIELVVETMVFTRDKAEAKEWATIELHSPPVMCILPAPVDNQ